MVTLVGTASNDTLNGGSGNDNLFGGGLPNTDYQQGFIDLGTNLDKVGYVWTNYGKRDLDEIKADIDLYDTYYEIDGIFLDEATSDPNHVDYYAEIYSYIKTQLNLEKVILNPGTNIDEEYVARPATDTAAIFENNTGWNQYTPDPYVANYNANRFASLMYDVANVATLQNYINLAANRNIGYVYVTNDQGLDGNPWDSLPSYWQQEVDYIESLQPNSNLEILLPLYFYPNWYAPSNYRWDDVAAASQQVPITAIINPNNGPHTGNDTLNGGAGDDRLLGYDGADVLDGGSGNDRLIGGAGNDRLRGRLGNDRLDGESGNDTLIGDAGTDTLEGNAGSDRLYGSDGNDSLIGVENASLHPGLREQDQLWGQAGADTFVLGNSNGAFYLDPNQSGALSRATISDFSAISGDKIQLSGSALTYRLALVGSGTTVKTQIFYGEVGLPKNDSIAIVNGDLISSGGLSASYFTFV